MSLDGQVALVTGAGRGIGRELALALAGEGAAIGLLGRSRGPLDAVLREVAAAGGRAVAVPADVTRRDQVRAAVDTVSRDLGPVDLLVSNAGLRERAPALPWQADPDDWWRVVETNLRGPFLLAHAVLPAMVARGSGRVLHLGSFSKILAPAMRLGWAVANPDMLERLTLLKLAADTQNSTLNMAATSEYLSSFDIDAHLERALPVYRHKRDLMLATMADTFPDDVHFTNPDGGLFVWLTFPEDLDATAFMADTLLPEAKVAFVPGATFFPIDQQPNYARLSFSGVPDDRLVHGISALGRLLHGERR